MNEEEKNKPKNTKGLIVENLVAIFIVASLFVCFVSMIFNGARLSLEKHDVIAKSGLNGQKVMVDWAEMYPVREENQVHYDIDLNDGFYPEDYASEDIEEPLHPWRLTSWGSMITKYEAPYISGMNQLSVKVDESKSYIPFYYKLSELAGRVNNVMGKTYFDEHRDVIRLSNGQLTGVEEKYDIDAMKYMISNVANLSYWVEDMDKDFVYIQYPYKESAFNYLIPSGYDDYSDYNADVTINYLEQVYVDCLDLRESIKESKMTYDDMYFDTDHHWNTRGGMWAAYEIASWINDNYYYVLDTQLLNPDLFSKKTYEKWSLGSYGRKVTLAEAEPDDFNIYIPDYDTNFRVVNMDMNLDITGSFEEVMVDYDRLEKKDYYRNICYDTLLYGNRPLTRITNLDNPGGVKILIIRDSFSLAMAPYLALTAGQVDLIDIRSNLGDFSGSVKTFIQEEDPDIVIVMTDIGQYVFH